MTTKSDKGRPQGDCNLRVSRVQARAKLTELVEKGKELLAKPIQNQQQLDEVRHDYRVWDDFNAEYLRRSFTTDELQQEYSRVHGGVFSLSPSFKQLVDYQRGDITHKITHLESIIERLELMQEETGVQFGGEEGGLPAARASEIASEKGVAPSNDVGKNLDQRIRLGQDLIGQSIDSVEQLRKAAEGYRMWDEWNRDYIYSLFESKREGNEYANQTGDASYRGYSSVRLSLSFAQHVVALRQAITEKTVRLQSLRNRYELIRGDLEARRGPAKSQTPADPSKVFIVHGRDVGIRAQVEAFLRRLKLEPIILQDMPNMGQSLLGKIRTNSGVAYAVVLLTGDDEGRLNVVGNRNALPELKPRARQNVVFELGFFLAQLGDGHVAALCQDGVEIPSDFLGIMYIAWDENGNWQMKLFKELQAAGLSVDANSMFK